VEQLAAVMLRSRRLLFIEAGALARGGQMTASSVPDLDEFEKSVLAKALTAPGEHMAIDEAHSTPLRTNVDRGPAKLREVLAHRRGDLTQPAVDVAGGGWQWSLA
jgi:hypothetical protein